MRFPNEAAETAFRVLNKCTHEMTLERPWRWRCVVQNGTRLPVAATLDDSFLHLDCRPDVARKTACTNEQAIMSNRTLGGGVKLALNGADIAFHMTADILVRDEKQLLERFRWALDGLHYGYGLLKHPTSHDGPAKEHHISGGTNLLELMRDSHWRLTERGPNEFSTELESQSSPLARLRASNREVALTTAFVRATTVPDCSRKAIALFLLTASSSLRLVRAFGSEADGAWTCGLMVSLPAVPAMEEIEHGLAALSIAHRMCAREAVLLLDEAAALSYLAARNLPTCNYHFQEQEI
jgi:hypothetical protein